MKIAIVAGRSRKELVTQFCTAYSAILSKHEICATGLTGKAIEEETALSVECLMAGSVGGVEQLLQRIEYNEIDLVLFFRDTTTIAKQNNSGLNPYYEDEQLILLCDKKEIPLATNIATAEALILCLGRGDFDYREYIK